MNVKPLTTEPAVTTGASLTAIITATLVLLNEFGADLTEKQSLAILGFVAALTPIVTAFLIRRQVWSPAGLAKVLPQHDGSGPAPGDKPGDHKRED